MSNSIIGYIKFDASKFKAPDDYVTNFTIVDDNGNVNYPKPELHTEIVQCIPLSELKEFSTVRLLNSEETEIVEKEGFKLIINDNDSIFVYRKDKI